MKLNKELEVLLNNQINMELAAAYQYQAMAAYFDERALEGFANWMGNQAKEEIEHSKKFYEYVLKRNGKIEFLGLDKPKMDFTSVKEVFEAALAHEESVTASSCASAASNTSLTDVKSILGLSNAKNSIFPFLFNT